MNVDNDDFFAVKETTNSDKLMCSECDTEITKRNKSGFCKDCKIKTTGVEGFFDFINDIRYKKTGKLMDNPNAEKLFDSYMILRHLSMDSDMLWLINNINMYQNSLSKKQLYKMLVDVIPKTKKRYKYIKKNKEVDDNLQYVQDWYQISQKEAKSYILLMGDDWAYDIKTKFGEV